MGGLRDEEHDVFVLAKCDFLCLEALLRMQCSRALGSIRSPCQPQVRDEDISATDYSSAFFFFCFSCAECQRPPLKYVLGMTVVRERTVFEGSTNTYSASLSKSLRLQ